MRRLIAAASLAALVASVAVRPAPAQAGPCGAPLSLPPLFQQVVPVASSVSCGAQAWPYGAKYSPNGDRLYVALFGGLVGNGGCRVQRLDPQSFAVLAEIPTGESPQDIALTSFPSGAVRLGFVTNSSASSVTVFNAQDVVVATLPISVLPGAFYPTAFPTSLAVSPNQRHVYVSTSDGSGRVLAIDTVTLTFDPTRAIQLGANHTATRMVFARETLIICGAQGTPTFTGSTAKVFAVDPLAPANVRELVLGSANNGFQFPSVQDCAVACDGTLWVAGFDLGPNVFAIDPRTLTVRHVVPTLTSHPDGKFNALGLSPQGWLVVGDLYTHEISVIFTRRRQVGRVIDAFQLPATLASVQELEFSPQGDKLIATWAGTNNLAVFDL
jgi:DNA-binding beta-propeller fold protein YncE